MEALNENKALHKQFFHLCSEKNKIFKLNNVLLNKLSKQEETLNELEQIKKTVSILDSSNTTLK